MQTFKNIAAYKFAPLDELKTHRARLTSLCKEWGLKGTILLSVEGINLFVAGAPDKVELLLTELRNISGLAELQPKVSESDHQPFSRMLVRIKKEIIAFGVPGINPAQRTSPKLSPQILKQWLDEVRPVTLLDTRNDYEVKLGTFKNALPIGVENFREFPAAVGRLPESLKEQPIVMFCTGGIRCEKAGAFMEREGFKTIFQLDGGILKYFEECGGAHYDGECFVFDQRVGVDPALQETDSTQCFNCQTPLSPAEQKDPRYVVNESCPYCIKTNAEQDAFRRAKREESIQRFTSPLPGSLPYDNFRPLNVPQFCKGLTMIEFLLAIFPHTQRSEWERILRSGLLVDECHKTITPTHRVHARERYLRKQPNIIEPAINPDIHILHEDEALIAVNKPAPLPMHPGGRFNRNTLEYILHHVYHPQKPRAAHRLDANTTGVVLITRTRHFAARLQPQFERGEVEKTYLVRVQGSPGQEIFSCDAPISIEPGELGTRMVDMEAGLSAKTEFRVLRRMADGTTLLEARPLTGRTNQIRVHLWQMGLPVCGDPVYLAGRNLGQLQTLGIEDPPLRLHSWRIVFKHPLHQTRTEIIAPAPAWAEMENI